MGRGHGFKLFPGLGERHTERLLSLGHAAQEILKRQRRLSGTRVSFDKVKPVRGQTSPEDIVQPDDSSRDR